MVVVQKKIPLIKSHRQKGKRALLSEAFCVDFVYLLFRPRGFVEALFALCIFVAASCKITVRKLRSLLWKFYRVESCSTCTFSRKCLSIFEARYIVTLSYLKSKSPHVSIANSEIVYSENDP